MKPRRLRSDISYTDAIQLVKKMAKQLPVPDTAASVTMTVSGKTFEALCVLGGHKLPAKAASQKYRRKTYGEWRQKFIARNGMAPYPADAWVAAVRETHKHYRVLGDWYV